MNSQNSKVQIITATLLGTLDEVKIDTQTDRTFRKVKKVFMYAGYSFATNKNCSLTSGLYIHNHEVFPSDFDSFLLFPHPGNDAFTNDIAAEAGGSQLVCKLKDTGNGNAPYKVTIMLILEDKA